MFSTAYVDRACTEFSVCHKEQFCLWKPRCHVQCTAYVFTDDCMRTDALFKPYNVWALADWKDRYQGVYSLARKH
jgi:hypothetical protein